MNSQKEEFESKNLDHLGIVAGIIDEIGIEEKINEIFLIDSREKINTGEVVKAIILNGLGFVSRPLYLFSQFFEDKAIEHLLGAEIKAEDLNDDKIGRGCTILPLVSATLDLRLITARMAIAIMSMSKCCLLRSILGSSRQVKC